MMGTKVRVFALLPPVSLEELVPSDHFYRHLLRTLDLGFVRDWFVMPTRTSVGRPSTRSCSSSYSSSISLRGCVRSASCCVWSQTG